MFPKRTGAIPILLQQYTTESSSASMNGNLVWAAKSHARIWRLSCIEFIKWLTEPAQNTKFVTSLGYVPVCYEAYDKYLIKETEQIEDPKYKDLYKTIQDINPDYEFVYPPRFESYLDSETAFTVTVRRLLSDARQEYIDIVDAGGNPDSAVYDISDKYFAKLQSELQ